MQYHLEPENLLNKLLPPALKKTVFKALLSVLALPLQSINDMLLALVYRISFELKYNGQVICLEEILNIKFPGQLPIFIVDNMDELPLNYIFPTAEPPGNETYIYPSSYVLGQVQQVYVYTQNEYTNLDDFIVNVPSDTYNSMIANDQLPLFKSIIDKRKIAGKKYSITTY